MTQKDYFDDYKLSTGPNANELASNRLSNSGKSTPEEGEVELA